MKLKLVLVSAISAMMFTSQAQASDREFGDIYKECGLGAMIFKNTPIAAAISNIIWDLGTTAISSNLSSDENCKGGKAKVAAFILKSYDKLESEIAQGEGQYINTLANMTNKDITAIRKEFSQVIANNDYQSLTKVQKAEKLYNIVSI